MHKLLAISMVCGALAACGSKKAPPAQEGPRAIDKPPPAWDTPPPPTVVEAAPMAEPTLVARPVADGDAIATVKAWFAAIEAIDVKATAALMTDDFRIYHQLYPGTPDCTDELMKSAGHDDVARVATCAIDSFHDVVPPLAAKLKKAKVTAQASPDWETLQAEALAIPGAPVFVAVSLDANKDAAEGQAIVAVVSSPDGPRIGGASAEITLYDE